MKTVPVLLVCLALWGTALVTAYKAGEQHAAPAPVPTQDAAPYGFGDCIAVIASMGDQVRDDVWLCKEPIFTPTPLPATPPGGRL